MVLTKPMTVFRALFIPFRVTPVFAVLSLIQKLVWLAIAPVHVLVTAYFINTAIRVVTDGVNASSMVMPLVALGVFQIYEYLMAPLSRLLQTRTRIQSQRKMRVPLMEKRARFEYKHLENTDTVDLLNRVNNDPEGKLSDMMHLVFDFVINIGRTVSFVIILIAQAPFSGMLLVMMAVPLFVVSIRAGKDRYQAERDMTERSRFHWMLSYYMRGRETACERNLFGFTKNLSEQYFKAFETVRKYVLKIGIKWFIRRQISALLMGFISVITLFVLIPEVAAGNFTVGLYIALMAALLNAIRYMSGGLPFFFDTFAQRRENLKDFNRFLLLSETSGAESLPEVNPPAFEKIEFRNVTFSYPGTDKIILNKLNLTLEKGKHYAFVGANGAGKTTLTKLITRLYDNYGGEILLNGKELREWPIPVVKAVFAAVFQDFARYDISVADNIAIGKTNGASETEIDEAIKLSGFDAKTAKLSNGKNTLLGKTHEEGVDLSGGEWQRIAFARALVSPAAVKILDEPTAALDPVAESEMYTRFEEINKNKKQDTTTIYISHRLASAKMADEIFVLDNGRVAESGNHPTLMSANGLYAEMFESQRSWYI
jgi:ATP-binding cassette subfamily B protein